MSTVAVEYRAPGEALRLLAVHAHPDDESSKGAASTAKYVAEGVEVHVVSCTGGERGSILNPNIVCPPTDITALRQKEMQSAAAILGVSHTWLGFIDSGFPEGDPLPPLPEGSFAALPISEEVGALVDVIRRYRPHVITTYDENGGYPHPDHIRTHELTMLAYELAADDSYQSELAPWAAAKVYYHHAFTKSRIIALHESCMNEREINAFGHWLTDWHEDDSFSRVTTRVHCADYFEVRDRALLAHATQIDPDGDWFVVPREIEKRVWPTEDFELALSRIPHESCETDLFAGLR
jgi:mycothiol S-conjugate amidase